MLSRASAWKRLLMTTTQFGEVLSAVILPLVLTHTRSSHVKFSPNSRFVLASTQDSTIRLWNYHSSRCVKTYTGHTNRTYCIPACFITNTKGKYIVSGSEDHKLYLWDLQSREVLQILEGHRGAICAVLHIVPRLKTSYRRCPFSSGKLFTHRMNADTHTKALLLGSSLQKYHSLSSNGERPVNTAMGRRVALDSLDERGTFDMLQNFGVKHCLHA